MGLTAEDVGDYCEAAALEAGREPVRPEAMRRPMLDRVLARLRDPEARAKLDQWLAEREPESFPEPEPEPL